MAKRKASRRTGVSDDKIIPLAREPAHREIYWGVVSAVDTALGHIYPREVHNLYSEASAVERTIAYVDGRIVMGGLISGPVTADGFFTVRYVAVRPEFSKQGIGSALARAFEQRAQEAARRGADVRGVRLNAFNGAVGFYERHGFANLGTVLINGVEHARMQKEF